MTSGNVDSWDGYISGNFLKAINVNSENDVFVCIDVEQVMDKDSGITRLRLTLENNGKEFDFDLNKTNSKKAKELGLASPKAFIGKKVYFKKALVRNPKTNLEVDSLRIWKLE